MGFWVLILLNEGLQNFFKKPNSQNFTNYIWFLNYVFTRKKKLEEPSVIYQLNFRRWSLYQPVMNYQYFQRGDKKLYQQLCISCNVEPYSGKDCHHLSGICRTCTWNLLVWAWKEPLWSWRPEPWEEEMLEGTEAEQELITEFTTCFSSLSWGSRTGSLICLENHPWVGFWQAGFDFWGVLGTLQQFVQPFLPAVCWLQSLTGIPRWTIAVVTG